VVRYKGGVGGGWVVGVRGGVKVGGNGGEWGKE